MTLIAFIRDDEIVDGSIVLRILPYTQSIGIYLKVHCDSLKKFIWASSLPI